MARRLFKFAQDFVPGQGQQPPQGGAVDAMQQDIASQQPAPNAGPVGAGGPAPMLPQGQQWTGPRVSVFRSTSSNVPNDPMQLNDFVLNELYRKHPYLSRYPAEVSLVQEDDQDKVGDIILANEMGVNVSVPFVIRDGKLKPFVTVAVDGELYALGDEEDFTELMESPMPVGSTGKPMLKSDPSTEQDPKMDLYTNGPEDGADQSDRRATLDAMSKTAGLIPALVESGANEIVLKHLDIEPDVVQYERVPFGVLKKTASAACFEPMQTKLQIEECPIDLIDAFDVNPYTTVHLKTAADETDDKKVKTKAKKKRQKRTPVVGFAHEKLKLKDGEPEGKSGDTGDDKESKGKQPGGDDKGSPTAMVPVQVSELIDWNKRYDGEKKAKKKLLGLPPFGVTFVDTRGVGRKFSVYEKFAESRFDNSIPCCSPDDDENDENGSWIAFSDDRCFAFFDDYKKYVGVPLDSPPKIGMPVSKAFAAGNGTQGYLICKMPRRHGSGEDLQALGPIDFVKSDQVMFAGTLHDLVLSDAVERPGRQQHAMGVSLYVPKSCTFIPASKQIVLKRYDPNEVVGDVVHIEKSASDDGVVLTGRALGDASWGDTPIRGTSMSFKDAVFVLGAMGVEEDTAHTKLAEAMAVDNPVAIEVFDELAAPEHIDVDVGFLKFAAAMPAEADRFMAIQLLGSKTLDKMLTKLPAIKEFADDIAKITLMAQIGMGDIEETVAMQALKNLQELIRQMEDLKSERGLAGAADA